MSQQINLLYYKVKRKSNKNYSSRSILRKPFGAMVSSSDQIPQVPVMLLLIIHYFERPASSVLLVKSIHLRAWL